MAARQRSGPRERCRVYLVRIALIGLLLAVPSRVLSGSGGPPGVVVAQKPAFEDLSAGLEAKTSLRSKSDLPRQLATECLRMGRQQDGLQALTRFVVEQYGTRSRILQREKVEILSRAADAAVLMQCLQGTRIRDNLPGWLLSSNSRMRMLANGLDQRDDGDQVVHIVETLYDHDPGGRDKFFNLIAAMAVVWDQPRAPMHRQMGSRPPNREADLKSRYDYFRDLYSSYSRKALYQSLNMQTLCFVVDTPAPLSELAWARDNVRGSVSGWKKKFFDIRYDKARLDRGTFSWPHGDYTLAAIREKGGICVDQAYYAALTARAHGIPAIYFHGPGRRGGHAWFAYMKSKSGWELEVGRYEYDKYATGHAVNPQTNESMTDHDIEYTCESSLNTRQYETAQGYARIASVLLESGQHASARECAGVARKLARRYELPWDIEAAALEHEGEIQAAAALLGEKAGFFSRYPDIATRAREKQAALLKRTGQDEKAEQVLRRQLRRVRSDRGDLAQQILLKKAEDALRAGDGSAARRSMEKLLEDQINEGQKLLPLMERYLQITSEGGQSHEAARFMKRYVRQLLAVYGGSAETRRTFLVFLLKAYENAGDESGVRSTRRDLERLARGS